MITENDIKSDYTIKSRPLCAKSPRDATPREPTTVPIPIAVYSTPSCPRVVPRTATPTSARARYRQRRRTSGNRNLRAAVPKVARVVRSRDPCVCHGATSSCSYPPPWEAHKQDCNEDSGVTQSVQEEVAGIAND
jgi:hypothetical protein